MSMDTSLEEIDVEISQALTVRIAYKQVDDRQYIDLRKWLHYPNSTELIPSKRGIMLELETWGKVIPNIEKFLKKYTKD